MAWKEADEVLRFSEIPRHLKKYDVFMRQIPNKHHENFKPKKNELFIKDKRRFKKE